MGIFEEEEEEEEWEEEEEEKNGKMKKKNGKKVFVLQYALCFGHMADLLDSMEI